MALSPSWSCGSFWAKGAWRRNRERQALTKSFSNAQSLLFFYKCALLVILKVSQQDLSKSQQISDLSRSSFLMFSSHLRILWPKLRSPTMIHRNSGSSLQSLKAARKRWKCECCLYTDVIVAVCKPFENHFGTRINMINRSKCGTASPLPLGKW